MRFFFLLSLSLAILSHVSFAQGMLPSDKPQKPGSGRPGAPRYPLVISDLVPETIRVIDSKNAERPLRSFKTALDVMVVMVLSPSCDVNQARWNDLRRFWEAYKGWRVAFVALVPSPNDSLETLQSVMREQGLPFDVAKPATGKELGQLGLQGIPEILILDETNFIRYRGPLHNQMDTSGKRPSKLLAYKAIESVIGHTEAVANPEPAEPIGCPLVH